MEEFNKSYWDTNYSEPKTMDCIGNAKEHANYLKSFFELELIDISSVVDLGAGYGYLFQKVLKTFIPYKACAIEPSKYAFEKMRARKIKPVESTKLKLYQESIEAWCARNEKNKNTYDLALCTSVFQYLSEDSIDIILPIIASRVKFIY
ncbi:MAG: class I SAM-dependent methyltransferase, partial [Halobacteriovoraceae bacterium]|nr:class I SAM-dependent methyltransferase [Halobacteriovoraceae bacterium]